jgi:hypothetical protein
MDKGLQEKYCNYWIAEEWKVLEECGVVLLALFGKDPFKNPGNNKYALPARFHNIFPGPHQLIWIR